MNGNVSILVNPEKKLSFKIKIRIPGWAQNSVAPGDLYKYTNENPAKIKLQINGKEQEALIKNGYIELEKDWKKGDKIELTIPMAVRKVIANEKVKDDRDKLAIEYGPLVYCAEEADNNTISDITMPENMAFNVETKKLLTDKVNILTGNNQGKEITLIPYYLWSNRGIGQMKVWFPREVE